MKSVGRLATYLQGYGDLMVRTNGWDPGRPRAVPGRRDGGRLPRGDRLPRHHRPARAHRHPHPRRVAGPQRHRYARSSVRRPCGANWPWAATESSCTAPPRASSRPSSRPTGPADRGTRRARPGGRPDAAASSAWPTSPSHGHRPTAPGHAVPGTTQRSNRRPRKLLTVILSRYIVIQRERSPMTAHELPGSACLPAPTRDQGEPSDARTQTFRRRPPDRPTRDRGSGFPAAAGTGTTASAVPPRGRGGGRGRGRDDAFGFGGGRHGALGRASAPRCSAGAPSAAGVTSGRPSSPSWPRSRCTATRSSPS